MLFQVLCYSVLVQVSIKNIETCDVSATWYWSKMLCNVYDKSIYLSVLLTFSTRAWMMQKQLDNVIFRAYKIYSNLIKDPI